MKQNQEMQYTTKTFLILALILTLALIVRFWGTAAIGLHGDEETSSMPALEVLRSGLPVFPSGMFYARAVPHSYLMAVSVWIFGHSEWALRLPSVLAGTLAVFFAYLLGKRFLKPGWNLFFAGIVALQPWMIVYSKTARMYIFLSAASLFFLLCILRWEKTGTWGRWLAAFGAFLVALSFQQLAIFFSFFFFIPALLKYSRRRFLQGALGFGLSSTVFLLQRHLISIAYSSKYGASIEIAIIPETTEGFNAISYIWAEYMPALLIFIAIVVLGMGIAFIKEEKKSRLFVLGLAVMAAGYAGAVLLQYHLVVICYVIGGLVLLRHGNRLATVVACGLPVLLLCLFQATALSASGQVPGMVKVIKTLTGSVSLYPYINFFGKFPIGSAIYVLPLLLGAYGFAKKTLLPEHYVVFVLTVWLPLFLMGFMVWYFSDRYAFSLVPFFVLCCLSGVLYAISIVEHKVTFNPAGIRLAAGALVLLAFVNPVAFIDAVNASYRSHPDHKGAAQFMLRLQIEPTDLVLAEDVLQQVYYSTKVDYWLRGLDDARPFVRAQNGIWVDRYTGTPLLGTGEEFQELIANNRHRNIFVIGSGETVDHPSWYLTNGLREVCDTHLKKAEVLFVGADGKTKIWKLKANR
jgi:4-amino-4-deoxy-L-arabinose transferase-like glycosyltransferase